MSTAHEPGGNSDKRSSRKRSLKSRLERLKRKKRQPFQPEFHGLEKRMMPSTYTVVNTNDSGTGSLREAISDANMAGGLGLIEFDIPGSGVQTISLQSALPPIETQVDIDGQSQPGYSARALIQIDGTNAGSGASGLELVPGSDLSIVSGLIVDNFSGSGVLVTSDRDDFASNYVGTNTTGTAAQSVTMQYGFLVTGNNNTIGGASAGAGNLISGNAYGIWLEAADDSLIAGNLIGTNLAGGSAVIGSDGDGILIANAAQGNTVGGATSTPGTGLGNVISGNSVDGVEISGVGTTGNVVAGNLIGTDSSGTIALGNAQYGVGLDEGTSANTIGGTAAGMGNVISGNQNDGIDIDGAGQTVIEGNLIGVNIHGTGALGNSGTGVGFFASYVSEPGAGSNVIGGTGVGAGNVISGNAKAGIFITNGSMDLVQGNLIGTNAAGSAAVPNGDGGILLQNGLENTIGGNAGGAGNVIAGNKGNGLVMGAESDDLVAGNRIGVNESGTAAIGNTGAGIFMSGQSGGSAPSGGNWIGGTTASAGNIISGNEGDGVYVIGGTLDVIAGNEIGTDASGDAAIPNEGQGIFMDNGRANTIGLPDGGGNVVSGNVEDGIELYGSQSIVVQDNLIGTSSTSFAGVPNQGAGIELEQGASDNTIGGATNAFGNVISDNAGDGVAISGSVDNLVEANWIGTAGGGAAALPNGGDGVDIFHGSQFNTIGGTAAGSGNVISGNAKFGVALADPTMQPTAFNVVAGNLIGANQSDTGPVPNGQGGVEISGKASYNTIGGLTSTPGTGAGNIISGNDGPGVAINHGLGNFVDGNVIGYSTSGSGGSSSGTGAKSLLANLGNGVSMTGASSLYSRGLTGQNVIGGSSAGAGNLISGNFQDGIFMQGGHLDIVAGNLIGTDEAGTAIVANSMSGVVSEFGSDNTIGGTGSGAGNVVSGNEVNGIELDDEAGDVVAGNLIGTDKTGTVALGNIGEGVLIDEGSSNNTIGGTATGAGNVISGNNGYGVEIDDGLLNVIKGNLIGTNSSGTGRSATRPASKFTAARACRSPTVRT